MKPNNEAEEVREEADEVMAVDDAYVEAARAAMGAVEAEDFEAVKGQLSTSAADGEEVTMVITGTAKGGNLTNIYGATLDTEDEPEEPMQGRMSKILTSGTKEE